ISSLSSSASTWPFFTLSPYSTQSFFTMPLALDLISTLVMGSILPVATTLFARSPFSTLASFEGSILVPPLDAISAPATTKMRTTAAIDPQMIRLRRFFFALPLPLPSTTASCLISNLRTGFTCCYGRKIGIVPRNLSRFASGRKFFRLWRRGLAPSKETRQAASLRNQMPVPPPNTHLDRRARKKKAINGHRITGFILIVSASSFPKPATVSGNSDPPNDYPFGMLELGFHDCIRAAAGVCHPAPGGGQCLLRRSRVRAGQRARNAHPAVDRSSPGWRPHRPQTSPATQPRG